MKLSGAYLIAAAQATPQPCGPRLKVSGLSGTLADLNGLWTFAMDGNGNVLENAKKPYYKRVGGDDLMWWMRHGYTGYWVVNKTPGKDSTFLIFEDSTKNQGTVNLQKGLMVLIESNLKRLVMHVLKMLLHGKMQVVAV